MSDLYVFSSIQSIVIAIRVNNLFHKEIEIIALVIYYMRFPVINTISWKTIKFNSAKEVSD